VIEAARTAQVENGLRHSDYGGYRQYCARRLRRVRQLRHVQLTNSKSKSKHAFVKNELVSDLVTSPEHLLLPLFNAERAWAHAMELKQRVDDVVSRGEGSLRPHHHRIRRFRKAVSWSEKLRVLCAERGDDRTALEAVAYASAMQAQLFSEEELWDEAVQQAVIVREALAALFETAMPSGRAALAARKADMEPVERFARFQLSREGEEAVAAAEEEIAAALAELKPRIDAVRAAAEVAGTGSPVAGAAASGGAAGASGDAGPESGGPGADAFLSPTQLLDGRLVWLGAAASAAEGGPTARAMSALANKLHAAEGGSAEADTGEPLALRLLSSLDDIAMTAATEAGKLRRSGRAAEAEQAAAISAAARWHKDRRLTESAAQDATAMLTRAAAAMAGAASHVDASAGAPALRAALGSVAGPAPAHSLAAQAAQGSPDDVVPVVRAAAALSLAGAPPAPASGAPPAADSLPAGGWWAQREASLEPLRAVVGLCDRCMRGCEELGEALGADAGPTSTERRWVAAMSASVEATRAVALADWHALSGSPGSAASLFRRAVKLAAAGTGGSVSPAGIVDAGAAHDAELWSSGKGVASLRRSCLVLACAAAAGAQRCRAAAAAVAAGGGPAAAAAVAIGASRERGSAAASEALAPGTAVLEIGGPTMDGSAPLQSLPPLPGWVGLKQLHCDVAYGALVPPDLEGRFPRRAQAGASAKADTAAAPAAPSSAAPPAAPKEEEASVIGSLFKMFSG